MLLRLSITVLISLNLFHSFVSAGNSPGFGGVGRRQVGFDSLGDDFFPRVPVGVAVPLDNERQQSPNSIENQQPVPALFGSNNNNQLNSIVPPSLLENAGIGDVGDQDVVGKLSPKEEMCQLVTCNFEFDQMCNWKACVGCPLAVPEIERKALDDVEINDFNANANPLAGLLGDTNPFGDILDGLSGLTDTLGGFFGGPAEIPRTDLAPPAALAPPPIPAQANVPEASFFGRRKKRQFDLASIVGEVGTAAAKSLASVGPSALAWTTRRGLFGIYQVVGVEKAADGGFYAGAYLYNDTETASMEVSMIEKFPMGIPKALTIEFKWMEKSAYTQMQFCCDSNCTWTTPYNVVPDGFTGRSAIKYSKWQTATITCPRGTRKLKFKCAGHGRSDDDPTGEGACAVDSIKMMDQTCKQFDAEPGSGSAEPLSLAGAGDLLSSAFGAVPGADGGSSLTGGAASLIG